MGIKSTTTLKRSDALELYRELHSKLYGHDPALTNHELGNALDRMADEWAERNNTVCFDNYSVVDDYVLDRDD